MTNDKIYKGAYESRNFSFEAFSLTKEGAEKAIRKAFYQYSLADLQSSINDICAQWHSAKIDTKEAKSLVKNCCAKFLEDNK